MTRHPNRLLMHTGRERLHAASGRLLAVCYGANVNSVAMLIALKFAGLRPDIITFANLVAEKPLTMEHLDRMSNVLTEWDFLGIIICRKETLPGTGYSDLYGNCTANETLPSLKAWSPVLFIESCPQKPGMRFNARNRRS